MALDVPDTIAQRVAACTICHGKEGRAAPDGYYPRLAGKPAGYLFNQLRSFRDGRRHYGPMTYLLDQFSDAYLEEIARYFAGLHVPYPAPRVATVPSRVMERGESLVTQGDRERDVPACTACHGTRLTGASPFVPGLLGLPRDYLNAQLGAWQAGQRKAARPDCMARIAGALSADDIAAVSAWLSSRPLPEDTRPADSIRRPLPLDCGSVPDALSGSSP
ncbi:MAG: c-type cytochrome [Betaproteobacteria bacterium]|nr:c-type cytochrome [Betaproteobacteria bacterium]